MNRIEIFRFLLVGAISAGTQFFSLAVLFDCWAFSLNFSVSASYAISVLVHFLGNKYYTFRATLSTSATEIYRYLSVVLINYSITIFVTWFFVSILNANVYWATVASIGATIGTGFALNKLWVFEK